MAFTIIAAAAAAIFIPPGNIGMARMVNADYPAVAEHAGDEGVVLQRVVIKPDGRAQRCEAVQTVGNTLFGEAACKSFQRWRFQRPRAADGSPVHALIYPIVHFTLERPSQSRSIQRPADITLTAVGISVASQFGLTTQIGPDGAVQHCTAGDETDARLIAAGCQAAGGTAWEVIEDETGAAVPYVRYVSVSIEPDPGHSPVAPTS